MVTDLCKKKFEKNPLCEYFNFSQLKISLFRKTDMYNSTCAFRTLQNEVYDLCAAQWSDTEIIVMGGNIFNEDFLDLVAVLVSDKRKKTDFFK